MNWYSYLKRYTLVNINKGLNSKPCSWKIIKDFVTNSTTLGIRESFSRSVKQQESSFNVVQKEYFLKTKIDNLVTWYEHLTGMDEVRFMQNRVIEAQDRLISIQNKRIESSKALSNVQNKLKDIYSELDTTNRGEERYLQLITQEHSILKEERLLNEQFNQNEKEERDCFSFLSSAVKESHEKERAQAERTKYWSVIGSIIGTIIGILGSSVNNEFKMRELKKLVQDSINNDSKVESTGSISTNILNQQAKELLAVVNELKLANIKSQENSSRNDVVLHSLNHVQDVDHFEQNITRLLEQQRNETRIALIVVSTVGIILPIAITLIQRVT